MNFQERAEPMIDRSIPVIPLRPKTKTAFINEWQEAATYDPFQIAEWNEIDDYNCAAVAKRKLGGFWFLDDDSGTLAKTIKAETGQYLSGFRVKTGRASVGYHYYFKHDSE